MNSRIPLEVIRIPEPCTADWNEMVGDDRTRFCKHCQLNVYNLSEMTRDAAEALVAKREGRLCVRLYQRADGTVITQDCENAWKLAARRARRIATAAVTAAACLFLAPLGWAMSKQVKNHPPLTTATGQSCGTQMLGKPAVPVADSMGQPITVLAGSIAMPVSLPATQPTRSSRGAKPSASFVWDDLLK